MAPQTYYVVYGGHQPPWPSHYPPPHKQPDPGDGGGGDGDGGNGGNGGDGGDGGNPMPSTTVPMNQAAQTQTPESPSTTPPVIVTSTQIYSQIYSIGTPSNPTALPEMASSTTHTHHSSGPTEHSSSSHHSNVQSIVFGTAGAIAVVIGVLLAIGGFIFCCRRQRRRKAAQAAAIAETQMAMKSTADAPPYTRRPTPESNSNLSSTTLTTSTTNVISPTPPSVPAPIILPSNNQSYFTGIDTSDHISIIGPPPSVHSTDNIYPSGNEDPPPPYRPRSVPPISRESSLRVADGMRPNFSTVRNSVRNSIIRSPFNDPLEEGVEVDSDPFRDQNGCEDDRRSIVSDLSYQAEPTTTHSTL